MKSKKISFNIALISLTIGSSLILGFLSFGGMLALWPLIPLAVGAFILSVGYEGEIYFQNIKSALKKLVKRNYIERDIGNEHLLKHFPDTSNEDCPQFFKDYQAQLNLSHKFSHKRLDKDSQLRQKTVDKILRDMEKWYATRLFLNKNNRASSTPYEDEIMSWLAQPENMAQAAREKAHKHKIAFNISKIFAVIAGLFMSIGSTYLLVGAFAAIPLLATIPYVILPIIIIPMAMIAGAAYSMLIFNAITDMVANDTVRKWYFQIRKDWSEGKRAHSIFIGCAAVLLGSLAITLTICTAGTWWTIAKTARPLFTWMSKIPSFVMGIINPIIVGISSIIFNWQNTSETLSMIDEAIRPKDNQPVKKNIFVRAIGAIQHGFQHLREKENWWQVFNPFRMLLKTVMLPLRIILFVGHLISMGVSDDRVPGIPEVLAAILGTTSEVFEDAHYFFDLAGSGHHHSHHHHTMESKLNERLSRGHGHSHANDLPTRFLRFILLPVYLGAASWDYLASKKNSGDQPVLSFMDSWEKHRNIPKMKSVSHHKQAEMPATSTEWKREHAIYKVDRFREKHFGKMIRGKTVAAEKNAALANLHQDLQAIEKNDLLMAGDQGLAARFEVQKEKPVYSQQRFFSASKPQATATQLFITKLSEYVAPPSI